jgi:hypothetical protein
MSFSGLLAVGASRRDFRSRVQYQGDSTEGRG